jgi:NitT/TauT family transport system substrate-binding protein
MPYLPLLVAQHKGFLTQQGLELEISDQQSPARAMAAVASGAADAFCGWFEHLLSAPGRAAGLRCFAMLGTTPMMALGVPVRQASAEIPANLWQLRGRKIGVVALNSPTHTVASAALRRAGLRASDVGFVSVGSPASALLALRSGQVDALIHFDPLMLELEQRGEIMTLCNLRSPSAAFSVLGAHLPSSCVAAGSGFFERFPGIAQALSDALVGALHWLQQASLLEVLQLQQGLPEASQSVNTQSFIASFERLRFAYSNNAICNLADATSLLQAMHDAEPNLRLEKIDPAQSINNALVQKSTLRLKA